MTRLIRETDSYHRFAKLLYNWYLAPYVWKFHDSGIASEHLEGPTIGLLSGRNISAGPLQDRASGHIQHLRKSRLLADIVD